GRLCTQPLHQRHHGLYASSANARENRMEERCRADAAVPRTERRVAAELAACRLGMRLLRTLTGSERAQGATTASRRSDARADGTRPALRRDPRRRIRATSAR